MKNFLMAGLVTITSALGATNPVFSQKTNNVIVADNNEVSTLPQQPAGLNAIINPKAIKAFRKDFSTVEGEKWFKLKNGYVAEFASDDTRYRVEYDNRGNWRATRKGYAEAKLQRDIRAMVKSTYFDYNIFWIEEITMAYPLTGPVYFIHIEDDKSFKSISVYNGELKVQDEFQK